MLASDEKKAKEKAKAFLGKGAVAAMAMLGGEETEPSFLEKNIIGVGFGAKETEGVTISGKEAVRIYVRVKLPENKLKKSETIPKSFGKYPTDVIEVGEVIAWQTVPSAQRFGRHRPASSGVSIGHFNITAGTLGCVVEKNGVHYILSNNHVMANSNAATADDAVLQPGPADGGKNPGDKIAALSAFKPIDYSGTANDMDAAIAEIGPVTQTDVEPQIIQIGNVAKNTKPPSIYQSVRKHGRTTGHTVGVITDISADLWVRYGNNLAWFEDQIGIVGVSSLPFSQPGDSGSLIVDAVSLEPVGLLFAGSTTTTFGNPIDTVLSFFNTGIV